MISEKTEKIAEFPINENETNKLKTLHPDYNRWNRCKRNEIFIKISNIIDSFLGGNPVTIFAVGKSGIGKTRLFIEISHSLGSECLYIDSDELTPSEAGSLIDEYSPYVLVLDHLDKNRSGVAFAKKILSGFDGISVIVLSSKSMYEKLEVIVKKPIMRFIILPPTYGELIPIIEKKLDGYGVPSWFIRIIVKEIAPMKIYDIDFLSELTLTCFSAEKDGTANREKTLERVKELGIRYLLSSAISLSDPHAVAIIDILSSCRYPIEFPEVYRMYSQRIGSHRSRQWALNFIKKLSVIGIIEIFKAVTARGRVNKILLKYDRNYVYNAVYG